jgi:cell division protein FtsN
MAMNARPSLHKGQKPNSYGYLKVLIFLGIGFILLMVLIPLMMNQRGKAGMKKLTAEEKMRLTRDMPKQMESTSLPPSGPPPEPKEEKTPTSNNSSSPAASPTQPFSAPASGPSREYPHGNSADSATAPPADKGTGGQGGGQNSMTPSAAFDAKAGSARFPQSQSPIPANPHAQPGAASPAQSVPGSQSQYGMKNPQTRPTANSHPQPGGGAQTQAAGNPHASSAANPQPTVLANLQTQPGGVSQPPHAGATPPAVPRAGANLLALPGESKEKHPDGKQAASAKGARRYVVQVGAFLSMENAEDLQSAFQQKGYNVAIKTRQDPKIGQLFLVQLAPLDDEKKAREVMGRIRKEVGARATMVSAGQ